MLIPSMGNKGPHGRPSLSRRVNANSQPVDGLSMGDIKLIKKGEC